MSVTFPPSQGDSFLGRVRESQDFFFSVGKEGDDSAALPHCTSKEEEARITCHLHSALELDVGLYRVSKINASQEME